MLALLKDAKRLEEFYFDCVAPQPGASPQEKARVIDEVRRLLASIANSGQRQVLAQRAELRLGIQEDLMGDLPKMAQRAVVTLPPREHSSRPAAELMLIEARAASREVSNWAVERGTLSLFRDGELADVGIQLADAWEQQGDVGHVVERLPAAVAARLTAVLVGSGPGVTTINCAIRWQRPRSYCVAKGACRDVARVTGQAT
jgi:hypothetical protein